MEEYLAKGTPIKMFAKEGWEDVLKRKKVSYKKVLYVVEGKLVKAVMWDAFVSGDTEEKGLSVVCLENEKYCVFQTFNRESPEYKQTIVTLRKGYDDYMVKRPSEGSLFGSMPVCPY